jgi:spore coat protein U-like protein
MRMTPIASLMGLVALVASSIAEAQPSPLSSCTVQVDPLEFDLYDVFDTQPRRSTGDIRVDCKEAKTAQVELSAGLSANFQQRTMSGAGGSLRDNIYVDLSETRIAGDGTNGTSVLNGVKGGSKLELFHYYGKIEPLQAVAAGDYVDEVRVTVVF